MTNIPYLLQILKTNKLSELVQNIDMLPLDLNLLIKDAERAGQIEVNMEKDRVKALVKPEISFDADLASKLMRTMQHYWEEGVNPTRGRLNSLIKDPVTGQGYGWHDYITTLQYLIDSEQVLEIIETIPKEGKRPFRRFVFLCLADNPNEDWNKAEINRFIANWNKNK